MGKLNSIHIHPQGSGAASYPLNLCPAVQLFLYLSYLVCVYVCIGEGRNALSVSGATTGMRNDAPPYSVPSPPSTSDSSLPHVSICSAVGLVMSTKSCASGHRSLHPSSVPHIYSIPHRISVKPLSLIVYARLRVSIPWTNQCGQMGTFSPPSSGRYAQVARFSTAFARLLVCSIRLNVYPARMVRVRALSIYLAYGMIFVCIYLAVCVYVWRCNIV